MSASQHQRLIRYIWLSIGAACATIALKSSAALLTGSVSLFSDALESVVNLVAALIALWAIRLANQPADLGHHFGHGKAEYLSAAIEGTMIIAAAGMILYSAIPRLFNPTEIDDTGIGLALAVIAGVINAVVGITLIRAGKKNRSIALTADGRHLISDVWTSVGVVLGVAVVAIFQIPILDPIIAIAVAANILWVGLQLIRRSTSGMLDAAISPGEMDQVTVLLDGFRRDFDVDFHAVRSRESGRQRFVYMHVLVPDAWTVRKGHELTMMIRDAIAQVLPDTITFTHIEPLGNPASYDHDEIFDPELAEEEAAAGSTEHLPAHPLTTETQSSKMDGTDS